MKYNLYRSNKCKLNIETQSEPWGGHGHQAYNKREKKLQHLKNQNYITRKRKRSCKIFKNLDYIIGKQTLMNFKNTNSTWWPQGCQNTYNDFAKRLETKNPLLKKKSRNLKR